MKAEWPSIATESFECTESSTAHSQLWSLLYILQVLMCIPSSSSSESSKSLVCGSKQHVICVSNTYLNLWEQGSPISSECHYPIFMFLRHVSFFFPWGKTSFGTCLATYPRLSSNSQSSCLSLLCARQTPPHWALRSCIFIYYQLKDF